MKKILGLLAAVLICCCCLNGWSQQDANTKAMMAYMTPGTVQQMLAKATGTWTAAVNFWMAPNTQPMSSVMETSYEMILGGRYLQGKNTGKMMGMPFEGIGVTGYDNAKKVFVSSWIDNMGTGMLYMEGAWDDASKSISFKGTMVDPVSGKDVPFRQVQQFKDDNNQTLVMYNADAGGKEFKSMEIVYTRK